MTLMELLGILTPDKLTILQASFNTLIPSSIEFKDLAQGLARRADVMEPAPITPHSRIGHERLN
jgi:hypothetical protein